MKNIFDVLFNKKVVRHNIKIIQSKLHRIGTYDVCKISFPCFDDKRYILDDGINTLAYCIKIQVKKVIVYEHNFFISIA